VSSRRARKTLPPAAGGVPDKLFFKIGEVARITGLKPYVLRYWETEFPQIRPRKGLGGQRVYRREDVLAILRIQQMLHREGYTIAGARRKLARGGAKGGEAEAPPKGEVVQKAREGLQDLLEMMDNTDSHRVESRADPGRGAVR
jgi:DNA-binding transcriptional MerR regulator